MATFYVGSDQPYKTIKDALNVAADDDTIIIAAGDYTAEGEIQINRALTVKAADGAEVVVDHVVLGSQENDLAVSAVTVSGLTIKPTKHNGGDWHYTGVWQNNINISAITIENCVIDFSNTPDDVKSVGIKSSRGASDAVKTLEITGNTIIGTDNTQSYITVGDKGSISSVTVEGNECSGGSSLSAVTLDFARKTTGEVSVVVIDNTVADVTNGHGINFGNLNNGDIDITVTGNTVENVTGEGRAAINMHETSTNVGDVAISGNIIANSTVGVDLTAIAKSNTSIAVTGNEITVVDGNDAFAGYTPADDANTVTVIESATSIIVDASITGNAGDIVEVKGKNYIIGTNAFTNLTDAVNAASATEATTITVAAGTYADDITLDARTMEQKGNLKFVAAEGEDVTFTGEFTIGYYEKRVGSQKWNADVTFEGITFDQATAATHSIDIQQVNDFTMTNCKVIGDGEYGISGTNVDNGATITGTTFENAGIQSAGSFGTDLLIDDCTFDESCVNIQSGNKVTIMNSVFNNTLTDANVGDSFYCVRSNDNAIFIANTVFNIDSELTEVAADQAWGVLWQRNAGGTNWKAFNCEFNFTEAAMLQTELLVNKNGTTNAANEAGRVMIYAFGSSDNDVADLLAKTEGTINVIADGKFATYNNGAIVGEAVDVSKIYIDNRFTADNVGELTLGVNAFTTIDDKVMATAAAARSVITVKEGANVVIDKTITNTIMHKDTQDWYYTDYLRTDGYVADVNVDGTLKTYHLIVNNADTVVSTTGRVRTDEDLRIVGGTLTINGNRNGETADELYTGSWGNDIEWTDATQVKISYFKVVYGAEATLNNTNIVVWAQSVDVGAYWTATEENPSTGKLTLNNSYMVVGDWNTITVGENSVLSLTNNSTIQADNDANSNFRAKMVLNGTLNIDADSQLVLGDMTIGENGKIVIDAADFTGTKKFIDLSDNESLAGKVEFVNKADNVTVIYGADGDVTLTDADMSKLYVNAGFTADNIAEGQLLGINAFTSMVEALKNVSAATEKIEITGNITESATSDAITVAMSKDLTISGGNVTWNSGSNWIWFKTADGVESAKLKFDNFVLDGNNTKVFYFAGNVTTVIGAGSSVSMYNGAAQAGTVIKIEEGGELRSMKEAFQVQANGELKATLILEGAEDFDVTKATLDNRQAYLKYTNVDGKIQVTDSFYASYDYVNVRTGGSFVADNSLVEIGANENRVWQGNPVANGVGQLKIAEGSEVSFENGTVAKISGNITNSGTIYVDGSSLIANGTLVSDGVIKEANNKGIVTNNGTIRVSGESALNIRELAGSGSVNLADGATLKDSTINGGSVVLEGTATIKGANTVGTLGLGFYNHKLIIGEDASLKAAGTGRTTLSYGNTIDVDGKIAAGAAKTADKTTLTKSLDIAAGFSFTGNGSYNGQDATLSVDNAYVSFGSSTSKNNAATGNFVWNFNNSIVDFTANFQTAASTKDGLNPYFYLNVTDSVFNIGTRFAFSHANSTAVVDNSIVTITNQFKNVGSFTLQNGSTMTVGDNADGPSYEKTGNFGTLTVTGKDSVFDITAGATSAAYAFYNAETGIVNVADSAEFKTQYIKNLGAVKVDGATFNAAAGFDNQGTVEITGKSTVVGTIANSENGYVVITGDTTINDLTVTGNEIQVKDGANVKDSTINAEEVHLTGGTTTWSGTNTVKGIFSAGYNNYGGDLTTTITGTFNGTNFLTWGDDGITTVNIGAADAEKTTFNYNMAGTDAQIGVFENTVINVVNADVIYGYAFIRGNLNATDSTLTCTNINTYIAGSSVVVVDNSTWSAGSYVTIGSYGGSYMAGNADVTLQNGAVFEATNLEIYEAEGKTVKVTVDGATLNATTQLDITAGAELVLTDDSTVTAATLTGAGSITIDATEFTGYKTIVDVNSSTFTGNITVTGNDAAYAVKGTDGDIILSTIDRSTLYVDSTFSREFGADLGDGKRYGINAFSSLDEALKKGIEYGGVAIEMLDTTVATENLEKVVTKMHGASGMNFSITGNSAGNEFIAIEMRNSGDPEDFTELATLTIKDANLNSYKLAAYQNSKITIEDSTIDFHGDQSGPVYTKGNGEMYIKNSTIKNNTQLSAMGTVMEFDNSTLEGGSAAQISSVMIVKNGSTYTLSSAKIYGNTGSLTLDGSTMVRKAARTDADKANALVYFINGAANNQTAMAAYSYCVFIGGSQYSTTAHTGTGTMTVTNSLFDISKAYADANYATVEGYENSEGLVGVGVGSSLTITNSTFKTDVLMNEGTINVTGANTVVFGSLAGDGEINFTGATLNASAISGDFSGAVNFEGDNVISGGTFNLASAELVADEGTFTIKNGAAVTFGMIKDIYSVITVDDAELTIAGGSLDAGITVTGDGDLTITGELKLGKDVTITLDNGDLDLVNGGTLTGTKGQLVMDHESTITFDDVITAGTLTVDISDYTAGTYRLFDYVGTGSMSAADYEALLGDVMNNDKILVLNNDLFLTDQDMSTLYVNASFDADSAADAGYLYGINAFSSLNDAVANVTSDTEEIVVSSDIAEALSGSTYSGAIVKGGEKDVVITDTVNNNYVNFTNANIGEGVTFDAKLFYLYGNNTFEGKVKASTTFYSSGKLTLTGNAEVYTAMSRYYAEAEDGIYVVGTAAAGEGKNAAVQFKATNYLGHYSGTFSVKDTAAEFGYILLNGDTDGEGYSSAKLVLDNAKVSTIGGPNTQPGQVLMNGDAAIIATNDSVLDFRGPNNFGYLSMGENNTLSLTDSELLLGCSGQGTTTLDGSVTLNGASILSNGNIVNGGTISVTNGSTVSVAATATLTNNGTFNVSGENTLKITALNGNAVKFDNATLSADSTIGGNAVLKVYGESVINGTVANNIHANWAGEKVDDLYAGYTTDDVALTLNDATATGNIYVGSDTEGYGAALNVNSSTVGGIYNRTQGSVEITGADNTVKYISNKGSLNIISAENTYIEALVAEGSQIVIADSDVEFAIGTSNCIELTAGTAMTVLDSTVKFQAVSIDAASMLTLSGTTVTVEGVYDYSGDTITNYGLITLTDSTIALGALNGNGKVSMDVDSQIIWSGSLSGSVSIDFTNYVDGAVKLFDYDSVNGTYSGEINKDFYLGIIGEQNWTNSFNVVDGDLIYDLTDGTHTIDGKEDYETIENGTELIVVTGGTFDSKNVAHQGIESQIQDGTFEKTVSGGKIVRNGDADVSTSNTTEIDGNTDLTVSGGTFSKLVMGADRVQYGDVTRDGGSNLAITGGTFNSQVVGGMAYTATEDKMSGEAVLAGNINLTIEGGTFNEWIYGGSMANDYMLSTRTQVDGNITITVDASENNNITFGEDKGIVIVAGSYGYGAVTGDTKVVFTGSNTNLNEFDAGDTVWGGSSADVYKNENGTRTFQTVVGGDRIFTFDNFTGDFDALIRGFNTMEVLNGSNVNVTNANLDDIKVWNFDTKSTFAGSLGDIAGDELNVNVATGWDETAVDLFSGALIEGMVVTLCKEEATWDAAISGYASDNYQLAYDDVTNRMKFSALA